MVRMDGSSALLLLRSAPFLLGAAILGLPVSELFVKAQNYTDSLRYSQHVYVAQSKDLF